MEPVSHGTRSQRWLARLSFVLAGLAIVVLLVFAGLNSLAMVAVGLAAPVVGLNALSDGESILMSMPVTCTVSPRALRVWVPRDRPGVPAPKPPKDWARLRYLAGISKTAHRSPH